MARLPAQKTEEPALTERDERFRDALVDRLADSQDLTTIARQLYPGKGTKVYRARRYFKRKVMKLAATDVDFQQRIAERSRATLVLALPSISAALAGRASRTGRPDAVKLAMEASGFHNPRVKHEHSGDIEIKLTMPRPGIPEKAEEPIDAEVVEEE